jgi:hypothetical protein
MGAMLSFMVSSAAENEMWLTMMEALVGEKADLEPARIAFEATRGDFATRFTAAVEALVVRLVKPEVFIDIPEHPEKLTKNELDALVRPAAGFLRSYPTKDELLRQLELIKWRQERRPVWMPWIDRDGAPLPTVTDAQDEVVLRPVAVSSFPELGEVAVHLPVDTEERPELTMSPGGIGELEVVLHTVLDVAGNEAPCGAVWLDARANEALVPEDARWWSPEPPQSVPAAQDPGVASELLATTVALGGVAVDDNTPGAAEAVVGALASAGDWRHSRHWRLDAWDPSDDTGILATAQAAIAGWADEGRSGLIMCVYGGAFHGTEGLFPVPSPLHSYLLCVTRSATGEDTVETVHRVSLSCPGENWCHRGGCPDAPIVDVTMHASVMAAGLAADVASGDDGRVREEYEGLYGASNHDEYADVVLDIAEAMLSSAGWVELERSTWEGGMEEYLARRDEHCLTVAYDPITRQIRLADGKHDLEMMLDLLGDEGILTGDDGQEVVDTSDDAVQQWGIEVLTAAEDLLGGRISESPLADGPVQGALLGLHPYADGRLHAPASTVLVERQLAALLSRIGVLRDSD